MENELKQIDFLQSYWKNRENFLYKIITPDLWLVHSITTNSWDCIYVYLLQMLFQFMYYHKNIFQGAINDFFPYNHSNYCIKYYEFWPRWLCTNQNELYGIWNKRKKQQNRFIKHLQNRTFCRIQHWNDASSYYMLHKEERI